MVDRLSYPVTGDHHLSDGWEDHIARGSLGGVDFPVAYGTPVHATHDGFLSVDNSSSGSGGRVATVQGGGITDQCLHMSSFVRGNGSISRGDLMGYSGASAYGSDYGTGGPHVHWHAIVNGIRVNPLNYLADFAGENITPISPEEDDMQQDERQKLFDMAWNIEQIKGQTDKIGRIAVVSDLLLWAATDPSQGIRQMIANLSGLVVKLDSDNLTKEQAELALKDALAPFTATTLAEQLKAAEARVSEAAAEAVAAEPAKP